MYSVKTDRSPPEKAGCFENFKQQKAAVWIPSYSAASISPVLILIGIILVPLGVVVFIISTDSSTSIKEYQVDYTYCKNIKNASETCADKIRSPGIWQNVKPEVCQCNVEFELLKPIKGEKIYMYYRLENFSQNVRQYVKSRDDDQLRGDIGTAENPKDPSKDCKPFDKDSRGRIYFPSGAIANSMFNDSIQLSYSDDIVGQIEIKQNRKGIAWSSDIKYRYKNPPEFYNRNDTIWKKFTKPKDWSRELWDLDPDDPENNGLQNEDLIVWMRPAAFSTFQKLYRIIESSSQSILDNGLPAGMYSLRIDYNYEVTSFGGRKIITLASPTILGLQNLFQGISLMSIGGLYVMTGMLLLFCGCRGKYGRSSFTKRDFDREL